MNKSYKFSIVIAIYNMENYIVETIDSIVNQTIGFEDNLQILLVNDGSIDNSGAICKSYATKYPENIEYIAKENGGVSDARNKGLEYAIGELVNFLDGDDKLELDALEKVYTFFKQNKEEVDLISIPLYFFEGQVGEHILNHKFTSTRVIDIFKEPMCFQMHISSSFIKLQEIKKYAFNTKLKIGEDAEVANKIILNKGKYGVVADTKYMYRKRSVGGSAIQDAKSNKANYIAPLKYLHLELIKNVKEKYNSVPAYLQWMLIYDLGWKIRVPYIEHKVLDQSEIEEFLGYVKQVLSNIDDEIILGSSYLRRYYNWYLLNLKHNDITKDKLTIISNKEEAVLCINNQIIDMLYKQTIYLENIEIHNNVLRLTGNFNFIFDQYSFKLIIDNNGVETELPYKSNENYRVTSLNQFVAEGYDFNFDIPLDSADTILKVKVVLGETKAQIKLMLKQDDLSENKNQVVDIDHYKITNKNKVIEIKLMDVTQCKVEKSKTNEMITLNKDITTLRKFYLKNKILPDIVAKILGGRDRKIAKAIMVNLEDSALLNMTVKKIPINYRYYLLSNLKYNGDYNLNIATTYNQACLYNKDNVLITKGTDITVNIAKCNIDKSQLNLLATIGSPLKSNMYKLSCCCDKQSFDCDLKINNKKSQKWFGESIVECCEFEITIPVKEKSEIYFVLNIGMSNSITKIQLKDSDLVKVAKKAGIMITVKEMQKIMLSY